ncbi:MAG: response regulator [Chloroflexi bacterium]|nr:response regulator [Chloroflexota bacterium]
MKKILVIEDDPSHARLISKIISREDLEIIVSEDVEKILELIGAGNIDLIILDIALLNSIYCGQVVNGVEVAKLIRGVPGKGNIPIIILTAYAMPGDDERLMKETGAVFYISKPIMDIEGLIEKINELIS